MNPPEFTLRQLAKKKLTKKDSSVGASVAIDKGLQWLPLPLLLLLQRNAQQANTTENSKANINKEFSLKIH